MLHTPFLQVSTLRREHEQLHSKLQSEVVEREALGQIVEVGLDSCGPNRPVAHQVLPGVHARLCLACLQGPAWFACKFHL